jgi:archaellum component FlaC
MWEREESLQVTIENSWLNKNLGSDLGALSKSLEKVTKDLKAWSKENFSNVTKSIQNLRQELERLECDDHVGNKNQLTQAKRELDELL